MATTQLDAERVRAAAVERLADLTAAKEKAKAEWIECYVGTPIRYGFLFLKYREATLDDAKAEYEQPRRGGDICIYPARYWHGLQFNGPIRRLREIERLALAAQFEHAKVTLDEDEVALLKIAVLA